MLVAARREPGRPNQRHRSADELVRAVRLDLEDVEPRVQRVVRLRREPERPSEDRRLRAMIFLTCLMTSRRFLICPCPASHGLLDRVEHDLDREVVGGPNEPSSAFGLSFFHPAIRVLFDGMRLMSGAKFETYEPGSLNRPGCSRRHRRTPSPACPARAAAVRTSARRPAAASGRTRRPRRSARA